MSSDSLRANGDLGAAPRLTWLRAAGVGICWGVGVSALESLKLPLGHLDPVQFAGFMAGIAPFWIIAGVALATGTAWLEHKRSHAMAITLVVCPLIAVVGHKLTRGDHLMLDLGIGFHAGSLHVLWSAFIYCGLFTLAYRLSVRSQRTAGIRSATAIMRSSEYGFTSVACRTG